MNASNQSHRFFSHTFLNSFAISRYHLNDLEGILNGWILYSTITAFQEHSLGRFSGLVIDFETLIKKVF